MSGTVVSSILEPTPERVVRRLEAVPARCELVEIRADALRAGDLSGIVRRAGPRAVVTVRTGSDGGSFDGSTEEKRTLLSAALSAGCGFVDVEWDGPLRDLAFGPESSRTILSHHGADCATAALLRLLREMAATKAARLKIVPAALRPPETRAVRDLLDEAQRSRLPLCAFASGPAGVWSRIFALAWGSWGTYGSAAPGRETGSGQLGTDELLDVYRAPSISESTRVFALCGWPIRKSPSPAMHAAGYRELGLDAVYALLPAREIGDVADVVQEAGRFPVAGLACTTPLKEQAAARCAGLSSEASCGSVNTVTIEPGGWHGHNTDAPAALELIRERIDPARSAIAIVGAGGTARAIAAALRDAGAGVTLYNRSAERASSASASLGIRWKSLDELPGASWDVLVQATPLGSNGEEVLSRRHLNGRVVLDAAYGEEPTPLVKATKIRGLAVIDGRDLLLAQAVLQFAILTGRTAPEAPMAEALVRCRDRMPA